MENQQKLYDLEKRILELSGGISTICMPYLNGMYDMIRERINAQFKGIARSNLSIHEKINHNSILAVKRMYVEYTIEKVLMDVIENLEK